VPEELLLPGIFVGIIFATILTIYFVKIARRLCSLLEVLQRETECRIRDKYELPDQCHYRKANLTMLSRTQFLTRVATDMRTTEKGLCSAFCS